MTQSVPDQTTPLFTASRWLTVPDSCEPLDSATLPAGFRAAGVSAGIKNNGRDVGLLVSDQLETTSAAVFTKSSTVAAPVQITRQHCKLSALRGLVVNSGNANAATGSSGLDAAISMQGAGSIACRVPAEQVAVASTGVIGVLLDDRVMVRGVLAACKELRADGAADFSEAILTTDKSPKRMAVSVVLSTGPVVISGQAKGAGMIAPNHATMLCFLQTDAVVDAELCDKLLRSAVDRSFDRITVDGQLSTNDSVFLFAGGASSSAVVAGTDDERIFGEALNALCLSLALDILRDGEGTERVGRVTVVGPGTEFCEAVARAVANSPLVKTALHGGDANWGRIIQAVGLVASPDGRPLRPTISIEGTLVASAGVLVDYDEAALTAAVSGAEIDYVIEFETHGTEADSAEVFFSDLSHEYVEINSAYRT